MIFTEVGEEEYNLLSDLNYAAFMIGDRKSRFYINEAKYGAFTKEEWFKYDSERLTEQGALDMYQSNERAKDGKWKNARKELYQYIGKDLDYVK